MYAIRADGGPPATPTPIRPSPQPPRTPTPTGTPVGQSSQFSWGPVLAGIGVVTVVVVAFVGFAWFVIGSDPESDSADSPPLPLPVAVPAEPAIVVQAETATEVEAESAGEVQLYRTLNPTEYQQWLTIKPTTENVLKGEIPLDSLTPEERELAARFYRATADETVGIYKEDATLYNIERARYLREGGTPPPRTLPLFIKSLNKPGS